MNRIEIESRILGECLLCPENTNFQGLSNYKFMLQEYQIIADAILILRESGERVDAITVLNKVEILSAETRWREILRELMDLDGSTYALKRCPFCGGDSEFYEQNGVWMGVKCTGFCSASIKSIRIKDNSAQAHLQAKKAAAELWNMRYQL